MLSLPWPTEDGVISIFARLLFCITATACLYGPRLSICLLPASTWWPQAFAKSGHSDDHHAIVRSGKKLSIRAAWGRICTFYCHARCSRSALSPQQHNSADMVREHHVPIPWLQSSFHSCCWMKGPFMLMQIGYFLMKDTWYRRHRLQKDNPTISMLCYYTGRNVMNFRMHAGIFVYFVLYAPSIRCPEHAVEVLIFWTQWVN